MGTTPRWKHRWNVAQETLAVRVLRITAGGGQPFTFLAPPAIADVLRHEGWHPRPPQWTGTGRTRTTWSWGAAAAEAAGCAPQAPTGRAPEASGPTGAR